MTGMGQIDQVILTDTMREISRLVDATPIDMCFAAGYDCGKNGMSFQNCHFRFFTTPARKEMWDKGKRMAQEEA